MKCSRALDAMIEYEDAIPPTELTEHLAACAACRRRHEQMQRIRGLVGLKRYETPDPAFEARSLRAIRLRLDELNHPPAPWFIRAWEAVTGSPLAALRYGAAAALAALVIFHVASAPRLASIEPPLPEDRYVVVPEPADTRPFIVLTEVPPAALGLIQVASNSRPGRLDYGPTPSMPVNLRY
jgi:hypothetical protein